MKSTARSRVYRVTIRTAKMSSMTSSKFTSGMGRRSKNPAASAVGNKRPLKRHEPSKFPAASAADNERPLERHEPSKAMYKVTIHSTPDQASKRTERTEVEYPGGV